MIDLIQRALDGEYGAALTMLAACIERADDATWPATVGKFPFWHVAYHVLFSTNMYLSANLEAFRPPTFHVEGSNWLGSPPRGRRQKVVVDRPYDQQTLAGYVETCRDKAKRTIEAETETTLRGASGFQWLKFTRLELHVYNIRHLQHHVGQLSASLRRHQGDAGRWIISQRL